MEHGVGKPPKEKHTKAVWPQTEATKKKEVQDPKPSPGAHAERKCWAH